MIDGITSRPFSAKTIPPVPVEKENRKREEVIKISREKYAKRKGDVEDEITQWAGNLEMQTLPSRPTTSRSQSQSVTLYDAKCSNCGKWTKVIFPPEPGKPVYCKSCLKKMKPARNASHSDTGGGKKSDIPSKITIPVREGKSGGNTELEKLGIEFGPAPSLYKAPSQSFKLSQEKHNLPVQEGKTQAFSLDEIMKKGEPVFFNKKKKKEVDIEDLKKTLTETLEKAKSEPGSKSLPSSSIERLDEPPETVVDKPEEDKKI